MTVRYRWKECKTKLPLTQGKLTAIPTAEANSSPWHIVLITSGLKKEAAHSTIDFVVLICQTEYKILIMNIYIYTYFATIFLPKNVLRPNLTSFDLSQCSTHDIANCFIYFIPGLRQHRPVSVDPWICQSYQMLVPERQVLRRLDKRNTQHKVLLQIIKARHKYWARLNHCEHTQWNMFQRKPQNDIYSLCI